MKKILISLAAAAAMTSTVVAGGSVAPVELVIPEVVTPWTGAYVGASVSANQTYIVDYSDWFSTSDFNKVSYGLGLNAGYTFYNDGAFLISAEGRYNTSLTGDDFVETSSLAVYLKPEYSFGAGSVYALLGYGQTDMTKVIDAPVVSYSVTDSVSDFSYGFGVGYVVADNIQVFADYTVLPAYELLNDESIENDVVSVGLNYRF